MNNRNNTTDLNEVRRLPGSFTWGKVVAFHAIGRYEFIEYIPREFKGGFPTGRDAEKTGFHIYVDGESTSNSESSLESALIHAIALGKQECNTARWMAVGAMKLLDIDRP